MLRMANVQLHLLPRELPAVDGLEMYAYCRPAREVGGDFYTFDRHTSGQCVLTIGDVSGKGLRAALLMAMVRTIVHVTVHALLQLEPKAIASKVNEYLYDDFTEVGMFATIFVSCYDPTTRRLAYTNAGHSPVIYSPAAGPARFLDADVPMIGVLPVLPTKDTIISLDPGDVLVMGTDGLSEAQNSDGEMFGYKRLLTLVKSLQQESAQNIAEALFEAVNCFAAGCEQFDDQTLVIIKGTAE
jgi:sigma-B regulation protein RsbU (phosphoserine phosphatase)